jgi:riboflavin kinase/FMN adenylyltransferase
MQVVHGVDELAPGHGPAFVVVGVFDGLHLGHQYLLEHLVAEAAARNSRPTVVTFDHHPDEVLTGQAPPLLLDPSERLERLAGSGVDVTVVQPFDRALRETAYDAFVQRIRARVALTGFLMTPDAAFGFERRGTPEALAGLGTALGFDVVVLPPFTLAGRAVRSSEIRARLAAGDLAEASALLGRPVTLAGVVADEGPDGVGLEFELPLALPPAGEYACRVDGQPGRLRIDRGVAYLRADVELGAHVTVELAAT